MLIGQQDPYLRTHPLTQERIDAVSNHIAHSPYSDVPERPEFVTGFKRIQAKLRGYTEPLARVLQRYPESDTGLEARYARSVAYAQPGQANLKKAIALADSLIAEYPDDPYFQENKAEILLKSANQAKAALPYYEKAATALPDSPMILLELAMAQLAIGDPGARQEGDHRARETAAPRTQEPLSMAPAQHRLRHGRTIGDGGAGDG